MSNGSLARRYARALLQLGVEGGNLERMGKEVSAFASALDSSEELLISLTSPSFPRSEREKVMTAVLGRLGAMTEVTNFGKLLLDRERVAFLPDISRELSTMIDEKSDRVRATVTSASPLSGEQQANIVSSLEKLVGKKIEAETKEDPSLLGGVIAQVGDTVYDGSLRTQLENFQQNLSA